MIILFNPVGGKDFFGYMGRLCGLGKGNTITVFPLLYIIVLGTHFLTRKRLKGEID